MGITGTGQGFQTTDHLSRGVSAFMTGMAAKFAQVASYQKLGAELCSLPPCILGGSRIHEVGRGTDGNMWGADTTNLHAKVMLYK